MEGSAVMGDWGKYQDILHNLYLVKNKSVKEIKEHMETTYKFNRE